MTKREALQHLKGQLIISYQVYEDSPSYGTENMVTMVKCMLTGEAKRIRACWSRSTRAIRVLIDVPLIGTNKVMPSAGTNFYDSVFITSNCGPTVTVIEAGCGVVALDGTLRGRNEKKLAELAQKLKAAHPDIVLIADLAAVKEGIICERTGFGILSSTLSGYIRGMMHNNLDEPDIQLIRELKSRTNCLVDGEGKIRDNKQFRDVWTARADMVIAGSAITNPMKAAAYLID